MNQRVGTPWMVTLVLVLIATAVRAGLLLVVGCDFADDPDDYGRLASNWAESQTFGFPDESREGGYRATAFRPPFYPWVLSWLANAEGVSQTGVLWLHVMIGVVTVWVTYALSCSLFGQVAFDKPLFKWLLLVPALGVCFDPLLLRSSQLLMTESLATLLGCLAWLVWLQLFAVIGANSKDASLQEHRDRSKSIGAAPAVCLGLVLGLAILTRPTAAPWAILLLLVSSCVPRVKLRDRFYWFGVAGMIVLLLVGSWTLRNAVTLGKPIWATSHGGYTLLLANNPSLNEHFFHNGPARNWDARRFHQVWQQRDQWTQEQLEDPQLWSKESPLPQGRREAGERDEIEQDQLAYSLALGVIRENPLGFARNALYRLTWFWAAWPNPEENGRLRVWGIGGWYSVLYVLALLGAWCTLISSNEQGISGSEQGAERPRSQPKYGRWASFSTVFPWFPAVLMISTLTAIHAVYWGNMRMRAPLMPMVYLLAMQGALMLMSRWRVWGEVAGSWSTNKKPA